MIYNNFMLAYTYIEKGKFALMKKPKPGRIDTTPLITHRFPLDQIEEAYRVFENKEDSVIKIAIK